MRTSARLESTSIQQQTPARFFPEKKAGRISFRRFFRRTDNHHASALRQPG
jgi:hypothetical protein